ncbi:MAG: hypothetical protein E7Z91_02095 [Cyanobacteria bacterium SIG30]|nr:hypothetical protein [Cyanobacteria bacterium SIG30]
MNKAKLEFITGSIFWLVAVLFLTVIPMMFNLSENLLVPNNGDYIFLSLLFFAFGAFLYITNIAYYKKQLVWISFLFLFYAFYQFIFLMNSNLVLLN